MSFLQVILQALFGALLDGLKAWETDQNLKALGYAQAQRDASTAQIKAPTPNMIAMGYGLIPSLLVWAIMLGVGALVWYGIIPPLF